MPSNMRAVALEVLDRGFVVRYLRIVEVEQQLPQEASFFANMPAVVAEAAKSLGIAPEREPYEEPYEEAPPPPAPISLPSLGKRKTVKPHAVFCATDEDVLAAVRDAREQLAVIEKLGLAYHG